MALRSFDERSAYQIVEGIYSSVITNDITKRHNSVMGSDPKPIAAMLENVMYFERRRRGYEVYIGKNETKDRQSP